MARPLNLDENLLEIYKQYQNIFGELSSNQNLTEEDILELADLAKALQALKDGQVFYDRNRNLYDTKKRVFTFIAEKQALLERVLKQLEEKKDDSTVDSDGKEISTIEALKKFNQALYSASTTNQQVTSGSTERAASAVPSVSIPQARPIFATAPATPVRNRPAFTSAGSIAQRLNTGTSKSTSAPTEQADKSQNNNVAYRVAVMVAWTVVEVGNMVIMSSVLAIQIQPQPQLSQSAKVAKDQSLQPTATQKPTAAPQNTPDDSLNSMLRIMHHMPHLYRMNHHLALALVMTAAFAVSARKLAEELENSQQFKADTLLAELEESAKNQSNSRFNPFAIPTLVRGKA